MSLVEGGLKVSVAQQHFHIPVLLPLPLLLGRCPVHPNDDPSKNTISNISWSYIYIPVKFKYPLNLMIHH